MAEREAAVAEQPFGIRPGQSGAQLGFAGHLVEPVQLVQSTQVQRDHGLEVAADRVKAADHAGAPSERDDRNAVLRAISENRGHIFFIAGQQHRVGRILYAGVLAAQQIQRGLTARTQQPGSVVDAAVRGPHDLRQPLAIGARQRRRPQPDLLGFEVGSARVVDAERLREQRANAHR